MSWQLIISLQVIVSTCMTLLIRHYSLKSQKTFFTTGALSYTAIAVSGTIISLIAQHRLPQVVHLDAWWFLVGEGICIPIAWLIQYRLIRSIGASNATLVSTFNAFAAAMLSIVLSGDDLSGRFLFGAGFLMTSAFIALSIKPNNSRVDTLSLRRKISLVILSALFFSIGMFCEKQAISSIGVWNYASIGWMMQAFGAIMIFLLFGRPEQRHISRQTIQQGILLGLVTSIAGCLFIYALSIGTLSHTVIATTAKVALTMIFAAIFLHETNHFLTRLIASILAIMGIVCIF